MFLNVIQNLFAKNLEEHHSFLLDTHGFPTFTSATHVQLSSSIS